MLLIRMRGRKYRLSERVLDPKRGFCPLFYVSTLGILAEAERPLLICLTVAPRQLHERKRKKNRRFGNWILRITSFHILQFP